MLLDHFATRLHRNFNIIYYIFLSPPRVSIIIIPYKEWGSNGLQLYEYMLFSVTGAMLKSNYGGNIINQVHLIKSVRLVIICLIFNWYSTFYVRFSELYFGLGSTMSETVTALVWSKQPWFWPNKYTIFRITKLLKSCAQRKNLLQNHTIIIL